MYLAVYSCHVTYALQSESTLYSSLSVKEFLPRSRLEIWSLSDCNWTRTHNHLVHKGTLNHLAKLAKWLSCVVSTYLYGAFISCSHLTFRFRACFEQGIPWHPGKSRVRIHSETRTWHDKNIQIESTVSILDQRSTSTKASTATTVDYGENLRFFGKTRL